MATAPGGEAVGGETKGDAGEEKKAARGETIKGKIGAEGEGLYL